MLLSSFCGVNIFWLVRYLGIYATDSCEYKFIVISGNITKLEHNLFAWFNH